AGDAIVETHSEGNQQISFLNGGVEPGFAVHAHHPKTQGMRRWESAETQQRETYGDVVALRERADFLHRSRQNNSVSGENDWPLCAVNQFERLLVFVRCWRQVWPAS